MSIISDIAHDVKKDIKTAMKIRPSGWSLLVLPVVGFMAYLLLDDIGRANLVMPIAVSAIALTVTVSIKWDLRRFTWFWVATALLGGLHILWVVFVPSTWIPAGVTAVITSVDGIAMLAVIDGVARIMRRSKA